MTDWGNMTHWYFGWDRWCEQWAMGDSMIDHSNGNPDQVDCPDCLEWMHA